MLKKILSGSNPAALLGMLPVIQKAASSLNGQDLVTLLAPFVGAEDAVELSSVVLRNKGVDTARLIEAVLNTKAAGKLKGKLEQGETEPQGIFVRCPKCETSFETFLQEE